MVLIRKQSACATKNMQEMQSLNCQRYCSSSGSSNRRHQMWVVGVILLLTTIIFTANAEQLRTQRHNDGPPSRTHFIGDDNLQVKHILPKKKINKPFNILYPKITKEKQSSNALNAANSMLLASKLRFGFSLSLFHFI